ncbi:MAG: hypothetical protein QGI86_25675 [Candidatus Poribacteria bacterium]|nr:hypothetical protein [Candidatus Poribacteria bacterium]
MSGKSTTNRRRGTVVTVPEGFSQRLRQLRKEKGERLVTGPASSPNQSR